LRMRSNLTGTTILVPVGSRKLITKRISEAICQLRRNFWRVSAWRAHTAGNFS
jgi:hypothetical protein